MMSFFSIIIPLYNKEHYIERTLNSVLSQTFSDFELIIINDGSTDQSPKIIAAFTDNRILQIHTKNKGVSAARNLGIDHAKGTYIVFLDADDFWEKNHLETLLQLCRAFPGAGMYGTAYRKVYSEKHRIAPIFKGMPKGFFGVVSCYFKASGIDALASSSSVCVAASVFKTVGGFDTAIRSSEDTDMWIRIALQYPIAFHNTITANYTINIEKSLSKGTFIADKAKVLLKFSTPEKHNTALKKYMDLNRYALAITYICAGDKRGSAAAIKNINYGNLNIKQRILIHTPAPLLRVLKHLQEYLAKKHIRLSSFT